MFAPVNDMIDDLCTLRAVTDHEDGDYQLTRWGEQELARMWGPDIAPPWSKLMDRMR